MHSLQEAVCSEKRYKSKTIGVQIGVFMVRIRETTSKFIKIRCPKCKNEQIIFGKATTIINCLVCGKVLAEPTGGKTQVKSRILEVLE